MSFTEFKEEYGKYLKIYETKARELLKDKNIPNLSTLNMVALGHFLEETGVIADYPILADIILVISAETFSYEGKVHALRNNLPYAFEKKYAEKTA